MNTGILSDTGTMFVPKSQIETIIQSTFNIFVVTTAGITRDVYTPDIDDTNARVDAIEKMYNRIIDWYCFNDKGNFYTKKVAEKEGI